MFRQKVLYLLLLSISFFGVYAQKALPALSSADRSETPQALLCFPFLCEHHNRTWNRENTDEVLEGLEFAVVELLKFRAETVADRRMLVLWLRFLKEVGSEEALSPELLEEEYIREAISICEEGAFTDVERKACEDMWATALC